MSSGLIETGLSNGVLDIHRALASLQEELEAIDYYHQRADATSDESLKTILIHNRNDEMEHASMLLEWLRRALPEVDVQMKKFIFQTGDLMVLTKAVEPAIANGSGLGLGNLN